MKINQDANKLTKIRLILASAISIYLIYYCIELIKSLTHVSQFEVSGENHTSENLLLNILLFTGVILFALNRKVTDYIAFSIFIFAFGGIMPFQFVDAGCLESQDYFNTCMQHLFFSLQTLSLLLMASPLIFLSISFYKRLKR